MATRGITLTRSVESVESIPNRGDGFRIKIVASLAVMMPNEVFLFKQNLFDPITLLTNDEFCAVVSPEDLVCFPVTSPQINDLPPFFRKDAIDVIVGSRKVALDMWDAVHDRVCELVLALDRKDRLAVEEIKRCGAAEDDTTSESSETVSISASA